MSIKVCQGTHGGINKVCDSCRFNVDNHPDFSGLNHEPEGKYEFLNSDICRWPIGPERKFWILYEPMSLNS